MRAVGLRCFAIYEESACSCLCSSHFLLPILIIYVAGDDSVTAGIEAASVGPPQKLPAKIHADRQQLVQLEVTGHELGKHNIGVEGPIVVAIISQAVGQGVADYEDEAVDPEAEEEEMLKPAPGLPMTLAGMNSVCQIIEEYSMGDPPPGWEPQMLAIWEYLEKNAEWYSFSKQCCLDLEIAHEKQKQVLNIDLNTTGETHNDRSDNMCFHQIWINQRKMTNLDTKEVYHVRRRLPRIKYDTICAGAVGRGKAIATANDALPKLPGEESDEEVSEHDYAAEMNAAFFA